MCICGVDILLCVTWDTQEQSQQKSKGELCHDSDEYDAQSLLSDCCRWQSGRNGLNCYVARLHSFKMRADIVANTLSTVFHLRKMRSVQCGSCVQSLVKYLIP